MSSRLSGHDSDPLHGRDNSPNNGSDSSSGAYLRWSDNSVTRTQAELRRPRRAHGAHARSARSATAASLSTFNADDPHPRLRTFGRVLYPVSALLLIVGAVTLSSHAMMLDDSELAGEVEETTTSRTPAPPQPPELIRGAVRQNLIEVTDTAAGIEGVRLQGNITRYAENNPSVLAGHLNRLMSGYCADNIELKTADNLIVNFFGYCFQGPDQNAIETLFTYADRTDALNVTFQIFPGSNNVTRTSITWEADSERKMETIERSWEAIENLPAAPSIDLDIQGNDALAEATTLGQIRDGQLRIIYSSLDGTDNR